MLKPMTLKQKLLIEGAKLIDPDVLGIRFCFLFCGSGAGESDQEVF